MTFATVAFYRALSGGFTNSKPERVLYAVVGWFLLGKNLWLTAGLTIQLTIWFNNQPNLMDDRSKMQIPFWLKIGRSFWYCWMIIMLPT